MVWVANNMHFSNGNLQWNLSFIKFVQDWEVDLVIGFYDLWYSLNLRQGELDCIRWIPSKKRKFEVRSFFKSYLVRGDLFLGKVFAKSIFH